MILRQPKHGYRVNLDTVLLAAAIDAPDGARVIELGCGVGAALLAVAKAKSRARYFGVERDPAFAALARENADRNGLTDIVEIIEGDALALPRELGQFDRVFFNPPYDEPGESRPPSEVRRGAHLEERPIADWINVWSNRMASDASLTLIHRAHRLGDILAALERPAGRCGNRPGSAKLEGAGEPRDCAGMEGVSGAAAAVPRARFASRGRLKGQVYARNGGHSARPGGDLARLIDSESGPAQVPR